MITNSVPTQSTNPIAILPSKQIKLNLTLTIFQNPHQCKILEIFWVKISMNEKIVKIWKEIPKKSSKITQISIISGSSRKQKKCKDGLILFIPSIF